MYDPEVVSAVADLEAKPQSKEDEQIYPIALATEAVNRALSRSSDNLTKQGFPPLKSADITFQTVTTKGWGLGISVFIVTLNFSHTSKATSTVTVHYQKDDPKKGLGPLSQAFIERHKDKFVPLEEALTKQIVAAAEATKTSVGGLPTQSITISVDFGVDWKIDGGVKTPTLVAASASLNYGKGNTHTAKLVYQK